MKFSTLIPALALLGTVSMSGCVSVDGTDKSTLSGAAIGALGAYSTGAMNFRQTDAGSDGYLYDQHKAAAGQR